MRRLTALLLLSISIVPLAAQKNLAGSAEIRKRLDKLNTLGSVLTIAAHPDDENTSLIAYFARGRHMRTGYLSLTRGEGGQNLIGSEQGDKMGLIRSQELLAARRVDGGEQYFSRAIDFGFSKNATETMEKWGRENILADMVWTVRKFRPDVIVLRFSGTTRDGHGHHQTSAILGKEVFAAAADATKFPSQLKWVDPWQAKRLYFNLFNFGPAAEAENEKQQGLLVIDAGEFDPVLGYSYQEVAGISRSQHRSQGMGSPERRGSARNHLQLLAGDKAASDPFEGIDTTWNRVPNGKPIGDLLAAASKKFAAENPTAILPELLAARKLLDGRTDILSIEKREELDSTIALVAGLWVDISAERAEAVPGNLLRLTMTAVNRSAANVSIDQVQFLGTAGIGEIDAPGTLAFNKPSTTTIEWNLPAGMPYTQPYWLERPKDGAIYRVPSQVMLDLPENPPPATATITATVNGTAILLRRPVHNRHVDRVEGEQVRPLTIVPPVAVDIAEKALVFPAGAARDVEVAVRANRPNQAGTLALNAPEGWTIEPASRMFDLVDQGQALTLSFRIAPGAGAKAGEMKAVALVGGKAYSHGMETIRYPHIPPQTLFPPATAEMVPVDVKVLAKKVGYIMGAGDDVPAALRQLGCEVTMLDSEALAREDLSKYDAIVTGVRAYNTRTDVRANHQRLMDYVENGGTMIAQYNVVERSFGGRGTQQIGNKIGPYDFQPSSDRVTVEEAPVIFPNPDSPLLTKPNNITQADFDGWVQERGLYFANKWDERYQTPFRSNDPGGQPLDGGTLVTKYGNGTYIFTAYAWFRQLPAGVPGAYRIFANFLSASKVQ